MLARGDGAARAAAEGGAVRQVVHLVDLVDVVRHLPRRDVAVSVGGRQGLGGGGEGGRGDGGGGEGEGGSGRSEGGGGKSSSGEGAAVAREHQLLGERMFRAALNVRVVARLRRVPIGRGAGASGSGHVGLYVLVVGLVHGLLTARAAHRRRGQDASCAAKGDSTVQCKLGEKKRTLTPKILCAFLYVTVQDSTLARLTVSTSHHTHLCAVHLCSAAQHFFHIRVYYILASRSVEVSRGQSRSVEVDRGQSRSVEVGRCGRVSSARCGGGGGVVGVELVEVRVRVRV